jgi:hypothetical protein
MPSSLRSTLEQLASTFTTQVLAALQSASLQDLLASSAPAATSPRRRLAGLRDATTGAAAAPAPRRSGKRGRRSAADFARALEAVVEAVKAAKTTGVRSEEIQKATGLSRKEIPLIIKKALAAKSIRRTGAKRATRYFPR